MSLSNTIPIPKVFSNGIKICQKYFLELSIVLLGFSLSYQDLKVVNYYTVFTLCSMVLLVLGSSYLLGRFFNLPKSLSFLIGIGNAICGSAAIMASSKIINPPKGEIASAVTVINILGIFSLFIMPFFLQEYITIN